MRVQIFLHSFPVLNIYLSPQTGFPLFSEVNGAEPHGPKASVIFPYRSYKVRAGTKYLRRENFLIVINS